MDPTECTEQLPAKTFGPCPASKSKTQMVLTSSVSSSVLFIKELCTYPSVSFSPCWLKVSGFVAHAWILNYKPELVVISGHAKVTNSNGVYAYVHVLEILDLDSIILVTTKPSYSYRGEM